MRRRVALLLIAGLVGACGESSPPTFSDADYQRLHSSFVVPAGFTPATPSGPCQALEHSQCWTTEALPAEAARAAVKGLGSGYVMTDTSWCGPKHWAAQQRSWGEAHTPCMFDGRSNGLRVVVEAIAFPDRKASTPGHLVFPPTLVSVIATI
jgi:hypothetical protein